MKIIAVLILLFMLALFIYQWRSMKKAQQMIGRKAPDTSTLEGAMGEGRRVYFLHARHCRPCRRIEPLVDRLQQQYPSLVKLDIAEHVELARAFQIAGTPSFVVVDQGIIKSVELGAVSEQWLQKQLTG